MPDPPIMPPPPDDDLSPDDMYEPPTDMWETIDNPPASKPATAKPVSYFVSE